MLLPLAMTALLSPALASPAERLDRLFAAAPLDDAGLAALGETDPATAWQRVDPASRAAIDFVLGLPAADIRRVREGQSVIRFAGEGSEAEWAALWRLAEALGERPRRVRKVHVHTVDAAVVRVDLELRGETVGVGIAWPDDAAPPRVTQDLWSELGVNVEPPAALSDGGFEVPWSAGLAWEEEAPSGTWITRDTARVRSGSASLRLESHTRAVPTVTQVLAVRPGDRLLLTAAVAGDGATPLVTFGFQGPNGDLADPGTGTLPAAKSGWTPLTVEVTVPEETVLSWVELSLSGPGAANFDEVSLRVQGAQPAGIDTWAATPAGSVVVHADAHRCAASPGGAACADAATRLDAALKAGLGRLSVPTDGTVDVWMFADAAHRAALAPRTPGGPRGFQDDYAAGTCWTVGVSDWSATCPVRVMLERAWGPPGNAVMGTGLPRALAGSGTDLHGAARPSLAKLPSVAQIAASPVGGPSRDAAVASFAAWLLDTQSLAAVRAAWQAKDIGAYTIAGRDLAALEAEWRGVVGPTR